MTLTSEVLPEPERPNSAVSRRSALEARVEQEVAEPVRDVDREAHRSPMRARRRGAPATRRRAGRAIEMTIDDQR